MTVNTNIQITNKGARQARTPKTIGFSFATGDWHPKNSDIYADLLTEGGARRTNPGRSRRSCRRATGGG